MTLEKQVCTLELAKKLKELGVKQESYFVYAVSKSLKKEDIVQIRRSESELFNNTLYDVYHAFTVAELGEMLPEYTRTTKVDVNYFVCNCESITDVNADGFTEADARAKMRIYLLENKLITL